MNDTDYAETVAEIKRLVRGWVSLFGLADWTIVNRFVREEPSGDVRAAAQTHSDWEYLSAEVIWYIPVMYESAEGIEATVIHELVHVLMADMWVGEPRITEETTWASPGVERVTTLIQKAFLRTKNYADTEGLWDDDFSVDTPEAA